ncbi:MAG: hypothetical protein QM756_21585 [Polyangiaceae bacterium]
MGSCFRTFDWVNDDDADYSSDFVLAVYDVATDEIELAPDDSLPGAGYSAHQDEAGNAYFSNWVWPGAEPSCAAPPHLASSHGRSAARPRGTR